MFNKFLVISIMTVFVFACSEDQAIKTDLTYDRLKEVPESAWVELSKKKYYFGHQSVGNNLVAGIRDLMAEFPAIKINIVGIDDIQKKNDGFFAHSRIGKNSEPYSKIDEFVRILDNKLGARTDAAALKFCFVDIRSNSNIEELFLNYRETMQRLKLKYPQMTVIHFTEPLTINKKSLKTRIKLLMKKKEIWELDNNVRRNEYNSMLVNYYKGKEPIFDIALLESTFPDGSRSTFKRNKKSYYSLVPGYTKDGAHLNEIGRKKVAGEFLLLLINIK
jgi:hypothetical protein